MSNQRKTDNCVQDRKSELEPEHARERLETKQGVKRVGKQQIISGEGMGKITGADWDWSPV